MDTIMTINPENLTLTEEQLMLLSPYLVVFGGCLLAIIASVSRMIPPRWPVFLITLLAVLAGAVCSADIFGISDTILYPRSPNLGAALFNGMMAADRFSNFFNIIFLLSAALTILASFKYLDREGLQHPEYYLLVLFAVFGMMLMASALDLIVIFIALELMSLSVYVLVGYRRADRRSNEAALKYFILGAAASAVLLYGVALLYGATGSTRIQDILAFIQASRGGGSPMFALGVWLVLLGYLFKVAAVPFHMWMPDVYEGAPTPVTGFMTTGLKAAAFASFIRVFVGLGYGGGIAETIQTNIQQILWVLAVLTMTVGNVIALTQTNLKRMLAYSSIAHTGYLLVGLLAGTGADAGFAPIAVYLVVYSIMNLGAFIILSMIGSRGDAGVNLHDVSGLARRHPWLSFSMAVFLLSMAGIPPTAGFAAKYLLFYSAIQSGQILLVVISVLCSAIAVYYYLRVIVFMYMREPHEGARRYEASMWSAAAVAAMVFLTLQIGLLPSRLLDAAKRAVTTSVMGSSSF